MHFSSQFDFFKYNGTIKSISKDIFNERIDKDVFVYGAKKLDSQERALRLCVFNFLYSNNWVYGKFEDAEVIASKHNKFYSRFSENIEKDLNCVRELRKSKTISLEQIMAPTRTGNAAPILQLYLQNYVSIECCCLLNSVHSFTDSWTKSIDPLVKEEGFRISKYTPFMLKFKHGQKIT